MKIGVDLGGTKIEILALDHLGYELFRKRVPTPKGDYDATIKAIADLIAEVHSKFHLKNHPIGIGTPGALSPKTGLMRNSNSQCLNGKYLDRDVESLTGSKIRLQNDANCFALSEAIDGAGKGYKTVFGVIIGTGTGGGIVVDKKVIVGPHGIAGEWGHNPMPWPTQEEWNAPTCYCGKKLCIENFLAGPSLTRIHKEKFNESKTPSELESDAKLGNRNAEETLLEFEDRCARALSNVINFLDPDVIVLGGGVSNVGRIYKNIPLLLEEYVFSDHCDTPILKAKYGDSSGVRGAAWLWD